MLTTEYLKGLDASTLTSTLLTTPAVELPNDAYRAVQTTKFRLAREHYTLQGNLDAVTKLNALQERLAPKKAPKAPVDRKQAAANAKETSRAHSVRALDALFASEAPAPSETEAPAPSEAEVPVSADASNEAPVSEAPKRRRRS